MNNENFIRESVSNYFNDILQDYFSDNPNLMKNGKDEISGYVDNALYSNFSLTNDIKEMQNIELLMNYSKDLSDALLSEKMIKDLFSAIWVPCAASKEIKIGNCRFKVGFLQDTDDNVESIVDYLKRTEISKSSISDSIRTKYKKPEDFVKKYEISEESYNSFFGRFQDNSGNSPLDIRNDFFKKNIEVFKNIYNGKIIPAVSDKIYQS